MHISDIVWLPQIINKLAWKHHVRAEEVEEILLSNPVFRKVQKGHIPGEDLYTAMEQTEAGPYLIVFFIHKSAGDALIISARDMEKNERGLYERR